MSLPFPATRFLDVLLDAAGMAGLVDEDGWVRDDVGAAFTRWINKWTRRGWTLFAWPELVLTEERRWRAAWELGAVYAAGDEVCRESAGVWTYYRALSAPAVGVAPESAPGVWQAVTDYVRLLSLDQSGRTPIGAVVAVWDRDPHVDASARRVPYAVTRNGLFFGVASAAALSAVWVEFRLRPSIFTSTLWVEDAAYMEGETRYVADAGDCYRALTATSGDYPPLSPDQWELVPMPSTLAQYVAQAAYSDWLREDGQHEKAGGELGTAGELLKDVMAQVAITQGQTVTYQVL